MVQAKDFDSEGNYIGREKREHHCPIDNCSEVQTLISRNKELSNRIRTLGIISLSVLSLVMTVILAMNGFTLSQSRETTVRLGDFVEKHNHVMLRDEAIHSTLVNQMAQAQRQIETITEIQREVIQEVSILKNGRVR